MRTIFRTHPALRECLIGIRIDGAGSVWDPFPGAHHLLEHLVSAEVENAIKQLGGRYDAFTYREYQTHVLAVPCDRVAEATAIISKGMHAVCDRIWVMEDLIDLIRVLHQERQIHERNPHEQLMEILDEAILCPAYARPTSIIKPPDSLQNESLSALARKAFHVDRATVVCLAPDDQKRHLVVQHLKLPSTNKSTRLVFPQCARKARTIQTAPLSKEESFIRFDFPGYAASSHLAPFNRIASAFLAGSYGALHRELNEIGGGWCYDVFSDTSQFALFAQVNCAAACAPTDLGRVHRRMRDVIERLYHEPFYDIDRWNRLGNDTQKDVELLQNNPYDLFEFLLEEAHPHFCGELNPQMLLLPWRNGDRVVEKALRIIFNPKTVSVAKTITSAQG